MVTLVEFLTARWAEVERVAQATAYAFSDPGEWRLGPATEGDLTTVRDHNGNTIHGGGTIRVADAHHIVTHDPAHVLADIAAKRKILAAYPRDPDGCDDRVSFGGAWESCSDSCAVDVLTHVLRLLAEPFRHHPDYNESWRP